MTIPVSRPAPSTTTTAMRSSASMVSRVSPMRAVSSRWRGCRGASTSTVSLSRASCSFRNSAPSVSEYSSWYSDVALRGSAIGTSPLSSMPDEHIGLCARE